MDVRLAQWLIPGFNPRSYICLQSHKEASENGSSETLDINRTLQPRWVTQYLRMLRHLDLNIRDMRYKVLATLNRHAQTNA
jgi:hypothetical protein